LEIKGALTESFRGAAMDAVIGASGLVGWNIFQELIKYQRNVVGTYFRYPLDNMIPLDIRSVGDVMKFFENYQPEIIYLPAALTNVDWCEANPESSYQVNVLGTKNIVDAALAFGSKLVFISSDYVFNGQNGPYTEIDLVDPISVYGQHKIISEHHLMLRLEDYLIIRTTVVYGHEPQGKNFVVRLQNRLEKQESIKVPVDQIGTPTLASDLAESIIQLAEKREKGIFNIAGPDLLNRYEFAQTIARVYDLDESLIYPVQTSEMNQLAKRPLLAGLISKKATMALGKKFTRAVDGLSQMFTKR
jgi:dTDP-4-dehydrorhamnose reductase